MHVGNVQNGLDRSFNKFCLTWTVASISKQTRKNRVNHKISVRRPFLPELKVTEYIFQIFVLAWNMLNTSIHIALIEVSANEDKYLLLGAG